MAACVIAVRKHSAARDGPFTAAAWGAARLGNVTTKSPELWPRLARGAGERSSRITGRRRGSPPRSSTGPGTDPRWSAVLGLTKPSTSARRGGTGRWTHKVQGPPASSERVSEPPGRGRPKPLVSQSHGDSTCSSSSASASSLKASTTRSVMAREGLAIEPAAAHANAACAGAPGVEVQLLALCEVHGRVHGKGIVQIVT